MIKKILFVDDSPIARRMMKSCIPQDRGYELYEAGDGLAGLEAYKEICPDITFMDLTMPVMDGFEATEKIMEFHREAIVIACTADIQIKSIISILDKGALMVLKKPPTKEAVEDALSKAEGKIGYVMDYCLDTISEEEREILQEIMNIAFGKAASDLAELIDIFVVLSVPCIQMLKVQDLPEYIKTQVSEYDRISIVEQNFWGDFKGSAFLVFQASAGRELVSLFGDYSENLGSESIDALEQETLMEVGNILIGACVGKLSELLGDAVTYSPPRVVTESASKDAIPVNIFESDSSAIVLKTVFCFNERNIGGLLFLVTSHDSILWLKKSLVTFMEQYE